MFGFNAFLISSSCDLDISKYSTPIPFPGATLSMNRLVPPYTSFTLNTCEPGSRAWRTVAVVALPLAKHNAEEPPDSMDARTCSREWREGFEVRLYSKP